MLESRSAYGFYGSSGGYTGEMRNPVHSVRMPYREYKNKWSDHKTVPGSYDKDDKTIEVEFTESEMAKKTNLGNKYSMFGFYFKFGGVEKGIASVVEFNAKSHENAEKNARAYARRYGYVFEREATRTEYCEQFI